MVGRVDSQDVGARVNPLLTGSICEVVERHRVRSAVKYKSGSHDIPSTRSAFLLVFFGSGNHLSQVSLAKATSRSRHDIGVVVPGLKPAGIVTRALSEVYMACGGDMKGPWGTSPRQGITGFVAKWMSSWL